MVVSGRLYTCTTMGKIVSEAANTLFFFLENYLFKLSKNIFLSYFS